MKRLSALMLLTAVSLSLFASSATAQAPLKVFVLVGQSNMQGHAQTRTLQHLGMNAETVPLFKKICDDAGDPRTFDQVHISYLSTDGVRSGNLTAGYGASPDKIGPELTFGITVHEALDEPILIIKAAWGGKSLNTDFRPPSAGPYVFSEEQLEQFAKQGKDIDAIQEEKTAATGHYYRLTLSHVQSVLENLDTVVADYDADTGYELAGFVWFQGWNDMVDGSTYPSRGEEGGYGEYSRLMDYFIRDVRSDLNAPDLPFVIGVLGVGGPTSEYGESQQRYRTVHQNFRDAMAAPAADPEFEGNVTAVLTENCWDPQLTELREREQAIRQNVKREREENGLDDAAARELETTLREEEFSERELEILEKAISNAEYHYLGSARILGCIGVKFAESVLEMQRR